MTELAHVIGASPPVEFDTLSADERTALATLVQQAARQRSDLLDHAIDDSLRHIPALLRGTVKRALGV